VKKRATSLVLATALGLGGVTAGLVAAPALAAAATGESTVAAAVNERVNRLTSALSSLVSDGTLTQAQADKVATTLAQTLPGRGDGHGRGGPGGPGGGPRGLDAAATALDTTVQELRTALRDGESLASIAEDQGVSKATLIAELVEAAEAHLAEHVADRSLTRAQADERKAELTERITALVEREGLPTPPDRPGPATSDATPDSGGTESGDTNSGTGS